MKNSIQRKLTLTFTALFTLAATIAGGIAFSETYKETHRLQDEMLSQLSGFIDSSEFSDRRMMPPPPLPPDKHGHPKDPRVAVLFMPHDKANAKGRPHPPFPEKMADGFYTLKREEGKFKQIPPEKDEHFWSIIRHDSDLYRGYVRNTPNGAIIITQEQDYRDKLAFRSALNSVLPLLILLPFVLILSRLMVRRAMKPVDELSKKIEQRHEQNLTPLPTDEIPREIRGFVVEINRLMGRTHDFIQQQKRFIADASHELRSPMTALSLQVEQLANQPLPEEATKQLSQVKQGIQRSRNLLEQLLSLERMQNNSEAHHSQFNLQTVFRRVIEDLLPLALDKDQDLGVTDDQAVIFYGNETDLYLLVKTLVDNVIRYTPKGSQIDLSVQQQEQEVLIQVEDNGMGIAPEDRERVLDPFYRILGTEQQGSGLGLAIASEIVKNYHGTIELKESHHFDHGLLVEIRLPIA